MLRIFLLGYFLTLFACKSTPFKAVKMSARPDHVVKQSNTKNNILSDQQKGFLKLRYDQLKCPSFAIINGSYRLPNASPFGSVYYHESSSLFHESKTLELEKSQQDYAIKSIDGEQALDLQRGINSILDLGVKLKELTMAQAVQIAQEEKARAKEQKNFMLGNTLLPEVDYLISFFEEYSAKGPVLVGRIIARKGHLVAFRVVPQRKSAAGYGQLIVKLFEDAMKRL